jgi:hypothetical protein
MQAMLWEWRRHRPHLRFGALAQHLYFMQGADPGRGGTPVHPIRAEKTSPEEGD